MNADLDAANARADKAERDLKQLRSDFDMLAMVAATGGRVVMSPSEYEHLRTVLCRQFALVPRPTSLMDMLPSAERQGVKKP